MTLLRQWRRVLRPLLLIAVPLAAGRIVIGLIGSGNWSQVASAPVQLSWVAVPVLLAHFFVRQGFNAVPLTRFVAGLGWWRSVQNDVTANLFGTIHPQLADVLRHPLRRALPRRPRRR